MEKIGWIVALRAARYRDIREAARASGVGVTLLDIVENGGLTGPGIARKIGKAYDMDAGQIRMITCQQTVERRKREKAQSRKDVQIDRMREVYGA
ncbi:MAG: hypothetical protein RSC06_08430 [Clostridia bacterium]